VDARLNGLVPWDAIEDRTRTFNVQPFEYHDPDSFLNYLVNRVKNAPKEYGLPKWYMQYNLVEVWAEKQALQTLFTEVIEEIEVTLGICRGYPSITFLNLAASRLRPILEGDEYIEKLIILYFGDHDPSGVDIERNIKDRLVETFNIDVEVKRIAITQEQIIKYRIPPMPTKKSDGRAKKYIEEYGEISSVELDALDPNILQDLIRESALEYFDYHIDRERIEVLKRNREDLKERVSDILKEK